MALIVQKFGGTSVGDVERIRNVARRVVATRAAGHQVAVIVSAMAGETNALVALAREQIRQRRQERQPQRHIRPSDDASGSARPAR